MAKRRIGFLRGKPIVEGDPNTITHNELPLSSLGGGINIEFYSFDYNKIQEAGSLWTGSNTTNPLADFLELFYFLAHATFYVKSSVEHLVVSTLNGNHPELDKSQLVAYSYIPSQKVPFNSDFEIPPYCSFGDIVYTYGMRHCSDEAKAEVWRKMFDMIIKRISADDIRAMGFEI